MTGDYGIINGKLTPAGELVFPLDDIGITHGYGCYETLKVRERSLFFPKYHEERLLESARILGIAHGLEDGEIVAMLESLVKKNNLDSCNIKLMLVGRDEGHADFYAFALPALHVPAGGYDDGVSCLIWKGERAYPKAKSLSLLVSSMAFNHAKKAGCWDALLVNHEGFITEGSRTNVFWEDPDGKLFVTPEKDCLSGITRMLVLAALDEAGQKIEEKELALSDLLEKRVAVMLSSTSSLVVPVSTIMYDESTIELPLPENAGRLLELYRQYSFKLSLEQFKF